MAEMRKLTSYFGQFDGTGKSWEDVEPYFADCFSKDCQIITVTKEGEGVTMYDEWAEFLKISLERNADIEMTRIEKVPEGIEYEARLCYPGRDPIIFASLGTFQDGKIMTVTPLKK
jgi:hypothetical protein